MSEIAVLYSVLFSYVQSCILLCTIKNVQSCTFYLFDTITVHLRYFPGYPVFSWLFSSRLCIVLYFIPVQSALSAT